MHTQQSLSRQAIKEIKHINWAAVARLAGISRSAISHTLAGRMHSKRVRRIICAATGLQEHEIWPHRSPRAA